MAWSVSRCEVIEMPELSEPGVVLVLEMYGELCELCRCRALWVCWDIEKRKVHFGCAGTSENERCPDMALFLVFFPQLTRFLVFVV